MYVLIETEKVYVFRDPREPEPIFRHLKLLLPEAECVIGVGCYDPAQPVKIWLERLPGPIEVPRQFDRRQSMAVYAPAAAAYYFEVTDERLNALADLAAEIKDPSLVCSHIVAYRGQTALISFHDAFEGGTMLISSRVSGTQVRAFGQAIGMEFKWVANPQWRPGRRLDGPSVEAALDLQESDDEE